MVYSEGRGPGHGGYGGGEDVADCFQAVAIWGPCFEEAEAVVRAYLVGVGF